MSGVLDLKKQWIFPRILHYLSLRNTYCDLSAFKHTLLLSPSFCGPGAWTAHPLPQWGWSLI